MWTQFCFKLLVTLFICRVKATISDKSWSTLNETVHGRVQLGSPIARPCFRLSQNVIGEFDEDVCQHIVANYTDREYRVSVFDAYMNTQWETCQATSSRCLLDSAEPSNPAAFDPPNECSQGSIPTHHIVVQTVSDVQAAFAFAKTTGINLVIKNTGHDYLGRSSGPNALALWTHQLQSLSYDQKFVPDGCAQSSEASPAVSFGAGVLYGTLYDFADQMNITLPGGSDRTLGAAGGYLQGGGHSALSNAFGLAVDRVLQFRVVTPSGKYVVANKCQNSDLFFALRGGGGGTFGVVLEATMKALPKVSLSVVLATFQNTDDNMKAVLKFMVSHSLSYAEQGWGGYILPRNSVLLTNPFINLEQTSSDMSALQDFVVKELGGTFALATESFSSFFNKYLASSIPVGSPFVTGSRLIPADKFSDAKSRQVLWERLVEALQNSTVPIIFAVAPYFYDGDDGETSVNSAWRNSIWHVTSSELWSFNTTKQEQLSIYSSISKSMDVLRDFTPTSGAYLNEADVYEPNYEASFWGAHYDRLVSIKKKYDPDHLLDCWRCVNWRGSKDPKYACYL
ncbi:FAD-binding domain-containing protein [Armillaria novae-zelandiae]|uniref:FAD-binding domain-containing protein n=1 Tax=Armillaria novae-zelandiae TaxID=153914 RepID=A0AA39NWB3_9AGAR|nr:FAD-binding domain-containing protein [Armillaria novae-zelandiae]